MPCQRLLPSRRAAALSARQLLARACSPAAQLQALACSSPSASSSSSSRRWRNKERPPAASAHPAVLHGGLAALLRHNAGGPHFSRVFANAAVPRAPLVATRPSSFRESQEHVPLSERQEALLLERLPPDYDEEQLWQALTKAGLDLGAGGGWQDNLLLMRSRLGRSMGRALVASAEHVPHVRQHLPPGCTYKPMDSFDVEAFVEQCERFVTLSDDLRRLAAPENFLRVITITELPSNYGRQDVAHILKVHCQVEVEPRDIVFRFKRWGRQADTCYVLCRSVQDADVCLHKIQELAVPKRAAYGALFGATFLWSSRATLFLSHPDLDFLLYHNSHGCSKFWVFTTGWEEDMKAEEFRSVMNQLQFFPVRVLRHAMQADASSAFFMSFESMELTKRAMTRLRRLKWRWRLKRSLPFFAYPRRLDVHRLSENGAYEDEDSASDSDIDEPVHY